MKTPAAELLGIREAATVVGRNPETVRRWVWAGRLRARKVRGRLMVERSDLDALIDRPVAVRARNLGEWLRETEDLAPAGGRRRSAADLVFEDRARRSGTVRDARR